MMTVIFAANDEWIPTWHVKQDAVTMTEFQIRVQEEENCPQRVRFKEQTISGVRTNTKMGNE